MYATILHRAMPIQGRRCRPAAVLCLSLSCALSCAMASIGEVAAAESNAERILEDAWGARPEDQKLADQIYLSDRFNDDTMYAYILTLVRQHRYDRASAMIDKLLDRSPDHSGARETRVWMLVARRQFQPAIPQLARWVTSIPADAPHRATQLATAGRLLGFIDVSLGAADAEIVLMDATTKIRTALPAPEWELFNKQRNRVHDRFSEIIAMRDKTVDELDEAFQKEKAERLDNLANERQTMSSQLDDLSKQSQTLRDELEKELYELERADQPLRQQLMSLDSLAASIYRQLSRVESQLFYLESRLLTEEDPYTRSWICRDISRLESLARNYDQQLLDLDLRASQVQAARQRVQAQSGSELSTLQNDLDNARRESSRVRDDIRKASAVEKKLRKDKGPAAKAAWRMTLRARTLGTYYDYSVDAKRNQFLESLKAGGR